MTKDLGKHLGRAHDRSAERDQTFPDSEPRDAATLMLIDRSGPTPKVLLGRRHAGHKFMPGKFVFPGGRIEPLDRLMTAVSELASGRAEQICCERVATPATDFARALALAAVRETAEETGLLLGVDARRGRRPCRARSGPNSPRQTCIRISARSISSPARSRRRAGRAASIRAFFTADASAIAHKIEGVVGPDSELVELTWVPIEEATRLDMPTITGIVLEELLARVEAGMAHDLPVPFYFMVEPQFFRELL